MVGAPLAVGVFGGTFDPIHAGHLRLARALRDELRLSEVRLIPAGDPYHRDRAPEANAEQRLAMARLAIEGETGLVVDDREVRQGRPSYTVETLASLRAELGPDTPIHCLIGGDSLATLDTWRRWREIFALAHVAVALRPGFDPAGLPEAVAAEWRARQVTDFPNRTPSGTIRALTLPPMNISATELRARLGRGEAVDGLIDPAVLAYIKAERLYGGATTARPT
ncbi:nicotinate-nucleotide adenylyltransferase [Crenobacter cavernae]|uniref:Probable nicotinate-nucleotide adenylyltransferase n=1 Tax=Crenobacter cavernae TaxID=2290923 RepID=A0A345Y598_9NEIS|nr:nicotinate-nucleotide adenylyltransferase [Crenobacter cavernae]AXK39100.1 nicotinate-nucleotide adenylyltransferase [Crenobacter cavernae]